MARYDHGVKFDYPSHNDGFVSHAARRGAEKTSTGALWLVLLIFVACVWAVGKDLVHSLGLWLLVIAPGAIVVLLVYSTAQGRKQQAAIPWTVKYTCTDGTQLIAKGRYSTRESAHARAVTVKTVRTATGESKAVKSYELRWDGLGNPPATDGDAESKEVMATGRQATASSVPPSAPSNPVAVAAPQSALPPQTAPVSADLTRQLKELAALRRSGELSEEEFARAKARLLGS